MPVRLVSLKLAATDLDEGDSVAVVGIHVGMYLEHEACELVFLRVNVAFLGMAWLRFRSDLEEAVQELPDTEVVEGGAEEDWRDVAAAVQVDVKLGVNALDGLELLA